MNVTLERFAYAPVGTFGLLTLPEFRCFTVERPWLGNEVRVSCIPEGEYEMRLGRFNRGGYPAYELLDVPGRTLIKIHRGNTMNDLLGCIAPGRELGFVDNLWAVTNSTKAYGDFMEAMGGTKAGRLHITHKELPIDGPDSREPAGPSRPAGPDPA